jgi:hypothetical protein
MNRSFLRSKTFKLFLALAMLAGMIVLLEPVVKSTHWQGSTKFHLAFVVTDAETGQPIEKATLLIGRWRPGREETEQEWVPDAKGWVRLATDATGTVKRSWDDWPCGGVIAWNRNTFQAHLPECMFSAAAPGYSSSAWISLSEYSGHERRADDGVTLTVPLALHKKPPQP